MKQEDKEILLKDLSARLPYNVIINYTEEDDEKTNFDCFLSPDMIKDIKSETAYWIIKPYLRPMSNMTEEEKKNLLVTIVGNEGSKYFRVLQDGSIDNTDATIQDLNKFNMHWVSFDVDTVTLYLDWLNTHHFDYRGLIEKGLAIEAPDDMYGKI